MRFDQLDWPQLWNLTWKYLEHTNTGRSQCMCVSHNERVDKLFPGIYLKRRRVKERRRACLPQIAGWIPQGSRQIWQHDMDEWTLTLLHQRSSLMCTHSHSYQDIVDPHHNMAIECQVCSSCTAAGYNSIHEFLLVLLLVHVYRKGLNDGNFLSQVYFSVVTYNSISHIPTGMLCGGVHQPLSCIFSVMCGISCVGFSY